MDVQEESRKNPDVSIVSQTSIPDDQIEGEGQDIKRYEIWKQVRKLHRKVYAQIAMAVFRNIMCWTCVVTFIVILAETSEIGNWNSVAIVLVVVLFSGGALTMGFHAHRAYLDLTFQKPTIVMDMLRDATSREEFNRKIQNRELSAPEIFVEVSLRGGAMSYEDPNHWTRSPGRKTTKELTYRGWADQSKGLQTSPWPEKGGAQIIVAKDFRCLDESTKKSIEKEAAEFRKDTDFDRNYYFMNFRYVLQWKESDSCEDAEVYLVLPEEGRAALYNVDVYRASWFLALDAVYRIVFHVCTKTMPDYYIVKFIER